MRDQAVLGAIFQALQENDPREVADATICYEIYDKIEKYLKK